MTAEHEALVLSLCTRGLMPRRVQYALLADLRSASAMNIIRRRDMRQRNMHWREFALDLLVFSSLEKIVLSITIIYFDYCNLF